MHMSDALLSPAVGLAFYGAAAGLLAVSARRTAREGNYEQKIPLMGVLGAFVFAAQMINFAIPGTGSSGHIGGGLLLSVLLGPWAAFLVIASVLVVQCLFFADGGLLALGCNIFNLGFWPAFVGLALYRRVEGGGSMPRTLWAAILATVVSLELGALSVVFQTLLSGRSELPFSRFAAVMLGIHLPIAVVEGLVTAGVVQFVRRLMPERIGQAPAGRSRALALAAVLGCAVFIGTVGAWFASSHPDGLEWSVTRVTGQEELSSDASRFSALQERTAFMPDYNFATSSTEDSEERWPAVSAGTSTAGLLGAGIVAGLVLLLGAGLRLTRRHRHGATA